MTGYQIEAGRVDAKIHGKLRSSDYTSLEQDSHSSLEAVASGDGKTVVSLRRNGIAVFRHTAGFLSSSFTGTAVDLSYASQSHRLKLSYDGHVAVHMGSFMPEVTIYDIQKNRRYSVPRSKFYRLSAISPNAISIVFRDAGDEPSLISYNFDGEGWVRTWTLPLESDAVVRKMVYLSDNRSLLAQVYLYGQEELIFIDTRENPRLIGRIDTPGNVRTFKDLRVLAGDREALVVARPYDAQGRISDHDSVMKLTWTLPELEL